MKNYIKKFGIISALLVVLSIFTAQQLNAAVHFIEKNDVNSGTQLGRCSDRGYTKTSCPNDYKPNGYCPQNNKYFLSCNCDTTKFPIKVSDCKSPMVIGGNKACNNEYAEKCECPTDYKFTEAQCKSQVKIPDGDKCGNKYKNCKCDPNIYNKKCDAPLQTGINKCSDNRGDRYKDCGCSGQECNFGGAAGAQKCEFTGKTYWSSCNPETCKNRNSSYITESEIPNDQKCDYRDTVNGTKCYNNCGEICAKSDMSPTKISGKYCTTQTVDSKTCYKCNDYSKCEEINSTYLSSVPKNKVCTEIQSNGFTCQTDCKDDVASLCTGYEKKASCPNKHYEIEKCPADSSYIKCKATCESSLIDKGLSVNEDKYNSIITKNTTFSSLVSQRLQSVENYRSYEGCTRTLRPKPTLTISNASNFKSKNIADLYLRLNGGTVDLSGTTLYNSPTTIPGNVYINSAFKHHSNSSSPSEFKVSGLVTVTHRAPFTLDYANADINKLHIMNGSPILIKDTIYKGKQLHTITTESRTEFVGNRTTVRIEHTYIGGLPDEDKWQRGAVIRVRDGAYWYMNAGNVQMRDGALFCAGYGGRILVNGGSFGGKYHDQYQGCRIYHKKDRTISYKNWDPSDYTSWNSRGGC